MDAKLHKVNDYYKGLYPSDIVVYHLPGCYVTLDRDAEVARSAVSGTWDIRTGVCGMPDSIESIAALGETSTVHVIDYRNDRHVLDFPNIELLIQQAEDDY